MDAGFALPLLRDPTLPGLADLTVGRDIEGFQDKDFNSGWDERSVCSSCSRFVLSSIRRGGENGETPGYEIPVLEENSDGMGKVRVLL